MPASRRLRALRRPPASDHAPAPPPRHHRIAVAVVASALLLAAAVAAAWLMPTAARGEPTLATAAIAPDEPWVWPVPPPIVVVAPFRAPPTPYAAGHRGIDIAASPGAVVVAPASGVVRFAGPVAGRGVVSIDHGAGVVSAIEPVEASVAAGTAVAPGDVIGTVASGGHCDAVCVHFGVRIDGEYVSPFLFLGGLPRAVLLPLG
ncbi:murein hydrolase activator EnvC family protein [Agromyces bauzanensis]